MFQEFRGVSLLISLHRIRFVPCSFVSPFQEQQKLMTSNVVCWSADIIALRGETQLQLPFLKQTGKGNKNSI